MRSTTVVMLLLLALFITGPATAQTGTKKPNFIVLVVPEADTVTADSPGYRLSASTNPGNTAAINGKPYKVYPSGAFAGLLPLQVGENPFTIVAADAVGDTVRKSFLIIRSKPLETTSPDSLVIEDVMLEPAADTWYNEGDLLEVQFKGTPNCKASFFDGLPMGEVSPSKTNGLKGIYQGSYKVRQADTALGVPVTFRLEDSTGHVVTKSTRAKVSFKGRDFPLVGTTKSERPFLNVGLGEDRLGGTKLSFINPGIRLAITGKVGAQYRVFLTENHEAWIPEELVDLQPRGTHVPFSLTGNWDVYGDARYDYVTISLNEKLPYASLQELEPTRIHIDVFGAVSNSNWITQRGTTTEIKNVYYKQLEKNLLRVTIELQHKQVWGYAISYKGNTLIIKIKRQPAKLKIKALSFMVDAGHGGSNKGALGSTGALEKDINLSTALHLKKLLEHKGAEVLLTRSDDSDLSMNARVRKVLESDADILISVHSNSIGLTSNPEDLKGAGTFYKYLCYRALSQHVLLNVLKTGLTSFGNVGSFNFLLNSPTELPNVLVEQAFMSNPEDEMKLLDDEFRQKIAEKIVDGVDDFLDACDN
jgi:N-acetylmuramoyl-L-alanine amidase